MDGGGVSNYIPCILPSREGEGAIPLPPLERKKGHFDTFPSNFVETDRPQQGKLNSAHLCYQRTVYFFQKRTSLCSYTNADLYSNIYSTGRPPFWRNWREIPSLPEGRFGNQEMNPPFTRRRRRRRRAVAFCLSSLLGGENQWPPLEWGEKEGGRRGRRRRGGGGGRGKCQHFRIFSEGKK